MYVYATGRGPSNTQLDKLVEGASGLSDSELIENIKAEAALDGDFHQQDIQRIYGEISGGKTLNASRLALAQSEADSQNMTEARLRSWLRSQMPAWGDATDITTGAPFETPDARVTRIYSYITGGRAPTAAQIDTILQQAGPNPTDDRITVMSRLNAQSDGDYHANDIQRIYGDLTGGQLLSQAELNQASTAADGQNMNIAQLTDYLRSAAFRLGQLAPEHQTTPLTQLMSDADLRKMLMDSYAYITGGESLTEADVNTIDTAMALVRERGYNYDGAIAMLQRMTEQNGDHHLSTVQEIYAGLYGQVLTEESARIVAQYAEQHNLSRDSLTRFLAQNRDFATSGVANGGQTMEQRVTDAYVRLTGGKNPSAEQISYMASEAAAINATDNMITDIARSYASADGVYSLDEAMEIYRGLTNNPDVPEQVVSEIRGALGDADLNNQTRNQLITALRGIAQENNALAETPNSPTVWTLDQVRALYAQIAGSNQSADNDPSLSEDDLRYIVTTANNMRFNEASLRAEIERQAHWYGEYNNDYIQNVYRSLTDGKELSSSDLQAARVAADQGSMYEHRLRDHLIGLARENGDLSASVDTNEDAQNYTWDQILERYRVYTGSDRLVSQDLLQPYIDINREFTDSELNTLFRIVSEVRGEYSPEEVSRRYGVITAGRSLDPDQIREIRFAANERDLNGAALDSLLRERALQLNHVTADGTPIPPEIVPDLPPGGTAGAGNTGGSNTTPTDSASSTRGNRPYRLIKGMGPALANDTLRGNGNAVFIVTDSGELFHVTENLANELRANGWWYSPEELPQGEVDKMTLRTSLTYTAELGVLDMKPAGDFLLIRGNGAALSNSQLRGNSDAVFAVDKNGNMFHVTEAVAKEMQANNTWMTPAMLNQQTVDGMKISGALTNAAGGTTPTLSIQPGTPVPTVMPAAGGTSGATGNPANPASATFKLVRGKGPNLGTTQLLGNGAAVYALFEDGTKLHVTEAMAKELDAAGKWYEPQQLEQSEIDKTPPAGRLVDINGGRGPLTVDYVAGGATPTTSTPVPTAAPDGPKASDRSKELVQATFRQYFGKDGTAAEVEAYALDMDNGRSLNVIRAEISAKPEAASFREDLIQQTFQQFVGRAADADDLRIHNEKLMSGEVTPEQFRIGIANAQEAVDWQNSQVAGVSGQAQAMYGEAIQNIYRQQLGRDASPEELRMHTAALSDGSLNLQQLTDQVYWSPEGSAFRGDPVTTVGPGSSVAEPAPAAGPTWTPDVQYDRTGASRDMNDPKYGYNEARKQELRVHMWNQGTWEEIATIEDIYASGDAGRIDAWERFSQTGKYAPGASQPAPAAPAAPAPAAATAPSPSAVHGDAVRAAYRQYLGREAAQSEVDNWSAQAAGGTNIVSSIAGSAEAAGYRQQIVRDTFRLFVCREPSAEDMAIHTDRLARGEKTPEQFRLEIANAPEAVINQNWLWAQQSPAAQAMYSEAINGIFVRQAGRPATQDDIRIHTAGLVNGLTNLQKLEENIASAVQNQGRLVKAGQVLGASTTVPMSSGLNTEGGTTVEDKPEIFTESAGSSDEDAIWVTDSAGVRRDISSLSWEKRAEVQKHVVEGGGSFNQLDQIENIYASGDASAIENWERFSQTGKYSPSTPWGQTYQSVIKDGYSHELASAWADGSHADNMQAATTPVPGVAPVAASVPNPNSFGVL